MIDPALLAPERVRPLRRDEYDRLVALGYFEDEKIELLDGALVAMSPQGAAHAYVVQRLTKLVKAALYARAGVPEYWIVNLHERVVEVHRDAQGAGYASVTAHGANEIIHPAAFADLEVSIADVLPRVERLPEQQLQRVAVEVLDHAAVAVDDGGGEAAFFFLQGGDLLLDAVAA
jgi:Uma2 family endonuclease